MTSLIFVGCFNFTLISLHILCCVCAIYFLVQFMSSRYRNDPKFSDRYAWETVQTQILEEQSDQGLHCLPFPSASFGLITLLIEPQCSNFRVITNKFFGCPNI